MQERTKDTLIITAIIVGAIILWFAADGADKVDKEYKKVLATEMAHCINAGGVPVPIGASTQGHIYTDGRIGQNIASYICIDVKVIIDY